MTNRETLDFLFTTGRLHLNRTALFDTDPPELPKTIDPERIEGMLLGLAIGDALGMTTEGPGWSVEKRKLRYTGIIRDYFDTFGRPHPIHGVGRPSDDTQLSFWTLEAILQDGRFIPEKVAKLIAERGSEIVGRGGTVEEFCKRGVEGKTPWYDWGPSPSDANPGAGLGNGAVMRIAPMLLPHLKSRTSELWVDTALSARMTHNTSISTAAALATVHLLWRCLGLTETPEPSWWVDEVSSVTEPLECQAYPPRRAMGTGANPRTLTEVLRVFLPKALERNLSVLDACSPRGWGSSSFVLETVPSLLYVLMKHGDSFEEAVVTAVNDTHDNDTIGAVCGAIMGALHGKKAIPKRWIRNLPGRTRRDDEGQVYRLIEAVMQLV